MLLVRMLKERTVWIRRCYQSVLCKLKPCVWESFVWRCSPFGTCCALISWYNPRADRTCSTAIYFIFLSCCSKLRSAFLYQSWRDIWRNKEKRIGFEKWPTRTYTDTYHLLNRKSNLKRSDLWYMCRRARLFRTCQTLPDHKLTEFII